jgi:hypothetical protein
MAANNGDPRGYIIIEDKGESFEGLMALTRGGRRGHHWKHHPNLGNCFVHSLKAIKRWLRNRREWMNPATTLIPAKFNRASTFAEADGEPLSVEQFKLIFNIKEIEKEKPA